MWFQYISLICLSCNVMYLVYVVLSMSFHHDTLYKIYSTFFVLLSMSLKVWCRYIFILIWRTVKPILSDAYIIQLYEQPGQSSINSQWTSQTSNEPVNLSVHFYTSVHHILLYLISWRSLYNACIKLGFVGFGQ